jgi:chemotaxis protein MotB
MYVMGGRLFIALILGGLVLVGGLSCVAQKKYEALQAERDSLARACRQEQRQMKAQIQSLLAAKQAREDSIDGLHRTLGSTRQRNDSLRNALEDLRKAHESLKYSSKQEIRDLVDSLEQLQHDLYNRETRLAQVQERLAARDSVLQELRRRLTAALQEFSQEGIAVEIRGDEVYVSVADRLLFESGQTKIDQQGQAALQQLAQVLKQTQGLQVIVEGHTDSQAVLELGCIDDNWELSVLRATEVVRYLVREQTVSPAKFTAAGRGEYQPVATNETPEGRAQNRRTEIRLAPDLQPLFQLIDPTK